MASHDRNTLELRPAPQPAPEPRKQLAIPANAALPALNSTPDVVSLLKALRRRWFLACALGVLAAGIVGVAAYLLIPSKFTAFALLQVSSRTPNHFAESRSNENFTIVMKTIAARLKSRDVLMRTLSQDQVRNIPTVKKHPDTLSTLSWMEEFLKIEIQDNSELLAVQLTGEDSNDLQIIVNNLVKSFMTIIANEDKNRGKDRLEKTRLLYETAKEKLTAKVQEKDGILKSSGAKDPWAMMTMYQNTQSELRQAQTDHSHHRLELERKSAQLMNLQTAKKNLEKTTPVEIPLKDLIEYAPSLRKLLDKKESLEKFVDRLIREGHPPTDGTLRESQAELAKTSKRIDEQMKQARTDWLLKVRSKQENEFDVAIGNLQTEVTPLKNFVSETKERIDRLTKELESINISNRKYEIIDNEIAQEQKNADRLFDIHKQVQMEADAEPRITLIGEAELQNRDLKKRLLMLICSPIGAFLTMLLAVAWWEFSAHRIHETDEVITGLAMRVVGAVPELPDPKRRRIGADPLAEEVLRHTLIESIDAIRTMLLRNASAENLRVIMVTSAVGGEGKTTLASNLAMSLARAGRKTLLMDCDLRRPAAHQVFEQTLQPGFSEVILHEVELPDAVRATNIDPNLFLLPAGLWDREVIQELAKTGMTSIFEKLRDEFDFVIVDSHPVLAATDSLLLAQHVDSVLVSLMRDVSQMHNVHTACQQLASLGIRLFGAVVNGMPVNTFAKAYQPVVVSPQPAN